MKEVMRVLCVFDRPGPEWFRWFSQSCFQYSSDKSVLVLACDATGEDPEHDYILMLEDSIVLGNSCYKLVCANLFVFPGNDEWPVSAEAAYAYYDLQPDLWMMLEPGDGLEDAGHEIRAVQSRVVDA